MAISIGDYVIMNDTEKPCTRLIAQVTKLSEGQDFVCARYICERVIMRKPYGRLSNATLISDFGVEIIFDGDTVTTKQVRPSAATYRDGKPRNWQPHGENPTQKLYRGKAKKRRAA